MNISENLMVMFNLGGFLVFAGWFVNTFLQWRRFKFRIQLHQRLMEKFNNAEELGAFLSTENGSKLLGSIEKSEKISPTRERLLSSITKAVVLAFLGGAFFLISNTYTIEESQVFGAFGIIAIALGLGFAVSTLISFKLSKDWGIINGD